MKTQSPLATFLKDDRGAVTVDWVILTAAIVGLSIAVMAIYVGPVQDAATGLVTELDAID